MSEPSEVRPSDVLDDLKAWAACKVGSPWPVKEASMPNGWGPALSALLERAIAEIGLLREIRDAPDPMRDDD